MGIKGHRISDDPPSFPPEVDEIRSNVQELTDFGHRGSATSREGEAAEWITTKLADLGVSSVVQPFKGRTSWAVSYLLHVSLAAIGAGLLPILPWASAGLAILVMISLIGEHSTRWPSLGQLLGSSRSRNVFAKIPARGEFKRKILMVAHFDTQRTGLIWNEATQPFLFNATWVPIWLRISFFPVTLGLGVQTATGILFCANVGTHFVPMVATVLLFIYVVTLALVMDWWRSPYVPGALDNASGVAAVLSVAKRFVGHPIPGVELWLLFTGCEESGLLGATSWAKEHASENSKLTFINMDCVGVGPLRYFSQETPVIGPSVQYPSDLLLQAQAVASTLSPAPRPIALPGPTDGLALLVRGFRGITILGLTADGRMPNYHQMTDTVEKVDFESIRDSVDFAWVLMSGAV